ncbi:MAG: hypothetical protein GX287_06700 [Fusobacteria bacterium]|nr:hypothetical protein [Fusobacteriota bacterium]
MNLVKFNGIKNERIIKGKKYIRTNKTIMSIKQYNSYIANGYSGYNLLIEKSYEKLVHNIVMIDKAVFAEIISKGTNRSLYLTIYIEDKNYKNKTLTK